MSEPRRRALEDLVVDPWQHFAPGPTDPALAKTFLVSGSGSEVVDVDGNRLLDGPGGMWCVNVGHGRDEIAEAMAAQARSLTYVSPWSFGVDPTLELTARLTAHSPGDLDHVAYTTGGSTAVDTALRFVWFRNHVLGQPGKERIISRQRAYHGSTYLSAAASGKAAEKVGMAAADHLVHHLSAPKLLDQPAGTTEAEFCDRLVAEFEATIDELGADTIAAFISEPVLASGGVIVPPEGYHRRMAELCRRHDILVISDEVVTAFGRLGEMFASERVFGVVPDIITTAKGLTSGYCPMGAAFFSRRLIDEVRDAAGEDGASFFNGFTYSGHPVAVAAAMANLDVFEREDLLTHVHDVAPYFQQRLRSLTDLAPVVEVRGVGMMAAVECRVDPGRPDKALDNALAERVDRISQRRGLIVRPIDNMFVMSPPLVITRDEVDRLVDILGAAIVEAVAEGA